MGQLNLKVPIMFLNDFSETLIYFKFFIMYQNFDINCDYSYYCNLN